MKERTRLQTLVWDQMGKLAEAGLGARDGSMELRDKFVLSGGSAAAELTLYPQSNGFIRSSKDDLLVRRPTPRLERELSERLPGRFRVSRGKGLVFAWGRLSAGEIETLFDAVRRVAGAHAGPALPLRLHDRYGSKEAFACFGIEYNSQQQHLNTGLSPRLPDGGHFIFVTLDKGAFDPAHAYADELYADRLIWVTRRDRGEFSEAYVRLRRPGTRVSLFVRNNLGEDFAYLGELNYESHREFREEGSGRTQQSYVWRLKTPVPDELFRELTFGRLRHAGRRRPAAGPAVEGPSKGAEGRRRPASLDELKKAYSYAVGEGERTVNPEHQRYQTRLRDYLRSRGLEAEFERDFVDVSFEVGGRRYIGEVKVTNNLPLKHAFRMALGQLLEYAHLKFERTPGMIMFLDQTLDDARLGLASRFSVSVVCEKAGRYVLLNPEHDRRLAAVFDSR